MPLFSIIIPAYNSERFIGDTLSMLVSQGLEDCEVIAVNDGSTDNTEIICAGYAKKYPNIRLISTDNCGVSAARNAGLQAAAGKYIYFLDSDDALAPESLDFFKSAVRQYKEMDMYAFGYESRQNGRRFRKYIYRTRKRIFTRVEYLKLIFQKHLNCHIGSVILSREFLTKNGLCFTGGVKIGEDVEFLIKCSIYAKSIYYNPWLCYIYQIRSDSTMRGYKSYSLEQFNSFILIQNITERTIALYPELQKSADFFIAYTFLTNYIYFIKSKIISTKIEEAFRKCGPLLVSLKNFDGKFPLGIIIRIFKIYWLWKMKTS